MSIRRLFLAVGMLLILPWTVRAQEASVVGTVTDSTGAVLPGVTVTAQHEASGNTFVAVTDGRGEYRLPVRTGIYKLTGELPGFTTVTRSGVELLVGQQTVLNFQLALSTVQETVTVSGEAPLIDTSQSKLGGNIDTRQLQELPVNGRNWMNLVMLAPGSRANAVDETPLDRDAGTFQLNVDGQEVTFALITGKRGQPRFSRDAIGEFEYISNRFDATHGRSSGVIVNAVTKSGTNTFSGTFSGYFRDDRFNAEDFIAKRVLPYSNQQVGGTFGGPIKKDKVHFFGYYEGDREPNTFFYTTPYPAFNISLSGAKTEKKAGARVDTQFSTSTRLAVRGNKWISREPYQVSTTGGSRHPSTSTSDFKESEELFLTFTQTLGGNKVNQILGGYSYAALDTVSIVQGPPQISIRGLSFGGSFQVRGGQAQTSIRDNFVTSVGGHELKLGGEYMHTSYDIYFPTGTTGIIDATGGPVPANLEALFPVWNDPSTWNLAALSPITVRYRQTFGDRQVDNSREIAAAWLQDNWKVTQHLTLNLGVRYDLAVGALAERAPAFPPFRLADALHTEWFNVVPRLGFAYALPDNQTVIRGGWGKYFTNTDNNATHHTTWAAQSTIPETRNDGRPNFAADPFNLTGGGQLPTFESIVASGVRRDSPSAITDAGNRSPYSWQGSLGFQRQLGPTMAIEADYAYIGGRREQSQSSVQQSDVTRNANLTYNPATGANWPFSDISKRRFPDWGFVTMRINDGWSNYHGLQTAFTKRFAHRWQASATYTLSALWDATGSPVGERLFKLVDANGNTVTDPTFKVVPDLGGEYTLAASDQRHRAVFNGIWQLPYDFQLSGLYFFGSGQRFAVTWSGDQRNIGSNSGRLRADGTIIARNDFVGKSLHRVDLRVSRRFPIRGRAKVDGIFEVFNLFNHVNYGNYVTVENARNFGAPTQNPNLSYAPRMLQLGFRFAF